MSALEELWLWLQGRSSQAEAGPDTPVPGTQQQNQQEDPAIARRRADETEARVQRHARYRAGPWQMK